MKRLARAIAYHGALGLFLIVPASQGLGVDFPGAPPGKAKASQDGSAFILENSVLSATWERAGGTLRPIRLANKLIGQRFDQTGAELFRLALEPGRPRTNGLRVAVRLLDDKVVALASKDGEAWAELATFPRADFPGEPRLVRLGKMNLQAQPKDNPGDLGPSGEGVISDLEPGTITTNRFAFKARAHQAATTEYPFPPGARLISCRIDKGTDQGMSWGPALALVWEEGRRFLLVGVRETTPVFNITTASGERIESASLRAYPALGLPASAFRLAGPPKLIRVAAQPAGVRLTEKLSGMALEAELVSEAGVRAHWHAELREDSNYIRQTVELTAPQRTVPLYGVELADLRVPEPKTIGSAPGCPVAAGGMFFGVEMPGAQNALSGSGARIGFGCKLELSPAQSYRFGAVVGAAPQGQLRRAFLYYVERERARPSKPFLHYNCWYDLGFSLDEASLLEVVKAFDQELVRKRGVPVLSYLADDGWDDPDKGLWVENTRKFPDGFRGLKAKMDYFANGAMLQELYLTPSMMTSDAWDQIAEAAKWAHANADVLVDAHWVGGDPLKLEPYGYASWSPRKGTLMLRNPSDQPQTIALDAATVFELPAGAPKRFLLRSPYPDQPIQKFQLEAGQSWNVRLEPYEVLVFDANPE